MTHQEKAAAARNCEQIILDALRDFEMALGVEASAVIITGSDASQYASVKNEVEV